MEGHRCGGALCQLRLSAGFIGKRTLRKPNLLPTLIKTSSGTVQSYGGFGVFKFSKHGKLHGCRFRCKYFLPWHGHGSNSLNNGLSKIQIIIGEYIIWYEVLDRFTVREFS